MSSEDLTECLRCGAMVDRMAKHRRWHQQLEGTSEPLPPAPDAGSYKAYSF